MAKNSLLREHYSESFIKLYVMFVCLGEWHHPGFNEPINKTSAVNKWLNKHKKNIILIGLA